MFGNITTINSNFSAMEALYNLKKTNGNLSFHQTRLSTGKRINSAEDDAAGYHIAKHLESRTRGLSQGLDNVSTAKNILNIAEGGYQSQMDILQQIKESLTQAADGALSATKAISILAASGTTTVQTTLADVTQIGFTKHIIRAGTSSGAHDVDLTTKVGDIDTIAFDEAGSNVTLMWSGTAGWVITSAHAGTHASTLDDGITTST